MTTFPHQLVFVVFRGNFCQLVSVCTVVRFGGVAQSLEHGGGNLEKKCFEQIL